MEAGRPPNKRSNDYNIDCVGETMLAGLKVDAVKGPPPGSNLEPAVQQRLKRGY